MVALYVGLMPRSVNCLKSGAVLNLNLEAVTIPIKRRVLQMLKNIAIHDLEHDEPIGGQTDGQAGLPLWGTVASIKPAKGLTVPDVKFDEVSMTKRTFSMSSGDLKLSFQGYTAKTNKVAAFDGKIGKFGVSFRYHPVCSKSGAEPKYLVDDEDCISVQDVTIEDLDVKTLLEFDFVRD